MPFRYAPRISQTLDIPNARVATAILEGRDRALEDYLDQTRAVFATLTADDAGRTNTTTLSDVSGFSFDVGANQVWVWEAWLPIVGNSVGDVKITWVWPASPTLGIWNVVNGVNPAGAGIPVTPVEIETVSASGTTVPLAADTNTVAYFVRGYFSNGINSGTMQFQYAQNTADATSTILKAGAFLRAERIV